MSVCGGRCVCHDLSLITFEIHFLLCFKLVANLPIHSFSVLISITYFCLFRVKVFLAHNISAW